MKTHSRRLLHLGLGLVIAPTIDFERASFLNLQGNLVGAGIDYDQAQRPSNDEIVLVRTRPPTLNILVKKITDQVHQLAVIATEPELTVLAYEREFAAVRDAYIRTWPAEQQVIGCEMTMRCLYETAGDHAFRDLWEGTLRQPPDSLATLGRPILGGGLRFVMPAPDGEAPGAAIEVKIESFLRDPSKLFIETQFAWQLIPESVESFDTSARIHEVDSYVTTQVVAFIKGESI